VRYLIVKNWSEFQHYKDRDPPWIKLHRTLLADYEFSRLQDASKAHLMLIWLFASQSNGRIPDDPEFLRDKLSLKKPPDLKFFVDHGLLIPEQDASKALQTGASKALALARSQEAEAYKASETETPLSGSTPDAPPLEKPKGNGHAMNAEAEAVLAYLNRATGRSFQFRNPKGELTPNAGVIIARLKEEYTGEQLREVVMLKAEQWRGDAKMAEFLRPETLFGKTKFATYIGELATDDNRRLAAA
jgi:uncharacterized phage protein (TIGR02220 family)